MKDNSIVSSLIGIMFIYLLIYTFVRMTDRLVFDRRTNEIVQPDASASDKWYRRYEDIFMPAIWAENEWRVIAR